MIGALARCNQSRRELRTQLDRLLATIRIDTTAFQGGTQTLPPLHDRDRAFSSGARHFSVTGGMSSIALLRAQPRRALNISFDGLGLQRGALPVSPQQSPGPVSHYLSAAVASSTIASIHGSMHRGNRIHPPLHTGR